MLPDIINVCFVNGIKRFQKEFVNAHVAKLLFYFFSYLNSKNENEQNKKEIFIKSEKKKQTKYERENFKTWRGGFWCWWKTHGARQPITLCRNYIRVL